MTEIKLRVGYMECKYCGKEQPKVNHNHNFCDYNCAKKYRIKHGIKPVVRKVVRKEGEFFDWNYYPMGVL